MSLSFALSNALSGLQANQAALSVISSNVSNANTEGYTRKIIQQTSIVLNGQGAGVNIDSVVRRVDDRLQLELRDTISSQRQMAVLERYYASAQSLFGSLADDSALSANVDVLGGAIANLSASPESNSLRGVVLDDANALAREVSSLAMNVQELRLDADREISRIVGLINSQLDTIVELNEKIAQNVASNEPTAEFEDKRDVAINEIAQYLDINYFTRETGEIVVYLDSGLPIVDSTPRYLSHDSVSAMGPTVTHALGSIDGIDSGGVDITNQIQKGELAALIEMRDVTLPRMQESLDRFAERLRDEVNLAHNQGSGLPPANSLTGSRSFAAPATDNVTLTSAVRIAVTDANGTVVDFFDLAAGTYTIDDIRDQINANIGANATATTAAGGPLAISADNAANGIAIVDLGAQTVTDNGTALTYEGFSYFFGLNDFFVTPGAATNDAITGIAQGLTVRDDLNQVTGHLSRGALSTDAALAVGDVGIAQGDNSIADALAAVFGQNFTFAAAGDVPQITSTLSGYAAEILGVNAIQAARNTELLAFETSLEEQLSLRFQAQVGVNVDEEMANLILYQNAYAASARVITTTQEMFDDLQRIIG